jgi:putative protease
MSVSHTHPPVSPSPGAVASGTPVTPARTGRLPELLAPAGDWDCARAAVENGADAIYFGLERFNARMRAHNFTEADLPGLMAFLHRRGVKGYVTFNTLIFENELMQAERYLRAIITAGVDAAIVQDVGICRLIRRLSPDFPIHVSTQMTITSAGGIEFTRSLGCNLVVLARECSLREIEKIQATLRGPEGGGGAAGLPLEVFVHGALCVAYSGQCLTSEALGGRSANRGECAQACRMPYELISDGQRVELGDRRYLLSPQDLAGLPVLPELARLGVASLKIEGRLKSPEYVANITSIYRHALDQLAAGPGATASPPRGRTQYEMEMAFSRGLYTGWLGGVNNQALVHGRFGKKRGVYLGQVSEARRDGVVLRLEAPVKPGDGVVFDASRPEEKEEGGRIYEIRRIGRNQHGSRPAHGNGGKSFAAGDEVLLAFGHGDINPARVHAGDRLWKTSDPELERHLRQSFEGDTPRFQRHLAAEIHGLAGKPLTLILRDEEGHAVQAQSTVALARAEKRPLTTERLRDQVGRLGGTPFKLGELQNCLEGEVILPVSELNRLRRDAVKELEELRARPLRWQLIGAGFQQVANELEHPPRSRPRPRTDDRIADEDERNSEILGNKGPCSATTAAPAEAHLIVLVRTIPQLEAALSCGLRTLYCELEDPKKYREAVALVRAAPPERRPEIWAAPPRIFKMGEEWTLKQVRSSDADGYLVRNYDHLSFFAGDRRTGDYSLNVANHWTAEYFKQHFGLERVTASYDLNFGQLEALLRGAPPEWFEVTLHQHIPMFHMEHCVFCAFLSQGTDYTNCGRPCDRHDVRLRDRVGAEHPVKADAGCRNTVFNALAQTGAEHAAQLLALGVRHFRLEFLNESPAQVKEITAGYRQLLAGQVTGGQLWRQFKLLDQLGVTRGALPG